MGLLDFMLDILNENEAKRKENKKLKRKEDFDCCYDCVDCPHSWECFDQGYYDDENENSDEDN